jgi:hypothetical protein
MYRGEQIKLIGLPFETYELYGLPFEPYQLYLLHHVTHCTSKCHQQTGLVYSTLPNTECH